MVTVAVGVVAFVLGAGLGWIGGMLDVYRMVKKSGLLRGTTENNTP